MGRIARLRSAVHGLRRQRYRVFAYDGQVRSTTSAAETLNLVSDFLRRTGQGPFEVKVNGHHLIDEVEVLEYLFTDARPEPGAPAEQEWAGAVAGYFAASAGYRRTDAADPPDRKLDDEAAGFEWALFARQPMPSCVLRAYQQLGEDHGTPVDVATVIKAVNQRLQDQEQDLTTPPDDADEPPF